MLFRSDGLEDTPNTYTTETAAFDEEGDGFGDEFMEFNEEETDSDAAGDLLDDDLDYENDDLEFDFASDDDDPLE